jgi:hypothetical protein
MQDLLHSLNDADYIHAVMAAGGLLLSRAVKHLGRIAKDINSLKTTVAVIATKTDSHGERLERIEMALFKST